jgi:hypothetical protein
MPRPNDPWPSPGQALSRSLAAVDQDSTLIAVIEISQSSWLVAGIVLGINRQPLKKLAPDEAALLQLLYRWREEATKAGHAIERIAVAYEAGRDGFWLTGAPALASPRWVPLPLLLARMGPPVLQAALCCRTGAASVNVEDCLIGGDLLANGSRFRGCRMIRIGGRRQTAELHQTGHQQ